MAQTKDELRDDVDAIREDLKQLREDLSKATGQLYESGKEKVNTAGHKAYDNAEAGTEYLQEEVRMRPLTSVLVATGVGFVLGSLFRKG